MRSMSRSRASAAASTDGTWTALSSSDSTTRPSISPPSLPALGGSAREGNILPLASRRRSVREVPAPAETAPGEIQDRSHRLPCPGRGVLGPHDPVEAQADDPGGDRFGQRQEAGDVEPQLLRWAAHDLLERVDGGCVKLPPILAEQVGGPRDRPFDLSPGGALDRRDDAQADRVAQLPRVPVRRVDPRAEVERPAERLDLGSLHAEQRLRERRPAVPRPPRPYAADRLEPAAADQVDQDGLGLVVERVTLGDRLSPDRAADVVRGVRARDGRPRLDD